jgi:hypothetical protein
MGVPGPENDLGSPGRQAAALTVLDGVVEFLERHDGSQGWMGCMIGVSFDEVNPILPEN